MPGARASFWRKALAGLGRGRHPKAYLHMLLFHFHTLHANALWKVPSRFPLGRPTGEEAGLEWKVPASQGMPLPGGGLSLLPPAACLVRTQGLGPETLSQRAPGSRRLLWPARPGELRAGCSRWAPASPGEVLVRRWVPASCLYSPQPRGEIPRPLFAAQRP